jgi:3-hydroxybutyryl-CoA dehydrogenase
VKADEIRRVLVVGASTMGQQIALQCALHGLEVVVHDLSGEALTAAPARIGAYAQERPLRWRGRS